MKDLGFCTVGEPPGVHYRVTPYAPDMSWLGEPMSERMAHRYDVERVRVHISALRMEREALLARADRIARRFVETPAQKTKQTKDLNEVHAALNSSCGCEICSSLGDVEEGAVVS